MSSIRTAFGLLIVSSMPLVAWGAGDHGDIEIDVPFASGPIVTSGGDWTGAFAGRVFEGAFPSTAPIEDNGPGFDGAMGTFPANANVRFDFVHQLLYWNGTTLLAPASSLTISYGSSKTATITGNDLGGGAGFDIPASSDGSFHEHVWYSLQNSAPDGLYGIVLTLGPGTGASGFTTSDPFLIAFSKGAVLDAEGGIESMVNAALVPEPSSLVLAGLGAVGAAAAAVRRRMRRRAA